LFKQFNVSNDGVFKPEFLPTGHKLGTKENLFERIKFDKPVENVVVREGFSKLNLKVGQIVEVVKHPDSEKLFILQINLGDEKRQIVSGLQELYSESDLQDRKVVVITNLKPAKFTNNVVAK